MSDESTAPDKPPEQDNSIQRLTLTVLAVAGFMLIWYLIADRYTPYTSEARVTGHVIPIAPRVSGQVLEVNVGVNEIVEAGELLFQIDDSDYQLAVDAAEAALEQATQDVGAGTENLAVAEAQLSQAKTQLAYYQTESKRIFELERRGIVPVADGDKARAEVEKAEAEVVSARKKLERAEQKLGDQGADNPRIRSALASLEDARLNLSRTVINAPTRGAVTNVNVSAGNYASAGQPLMTFVSADNAWIEAYLRENSLGNIAAGNPVDIVLDSRPGRVFDGEVVSIGYAVDWENAAQAGQVQSVNAPRNWLRSAQRFPVIIRFSDDSVHGHLRSGGQADIMVYTSGNWITNGLAWLWMRTVAVFSYAY
jgi:multidrug resistance efflux pump